jgi:thiol-disulfide isomerase/thioredoxin
MHTNDTEAPALQVSQWFNAEAPISLAQLRGKVVVIHAFQMLCPTCVSHGIPQAKAIDAAFPNADLAVIGLHTVFEHHAAMTAVSLAAFLHEYRVTFPVGIDMASEDSRVPRTMRAYGMRGTPTLIVLDRVGTLRLHHFGQVDDLRVGALIGQLCATST